MSFNFSGTILAVGFADSNVKLFDFSTLSWRKEIHSLDLKLFYPLLKGWENDTRFELWNLLKNCGENQSVFEINKNNLNFKFDKEIVSIRAALSNDGKSTKFSFFQNNKDKIYLEIEGEPVVAVNSENLSVAYLKTEEDSKKYLCCMQYKRQSQ